MKYFFSLVASFVLSAAFLAAPASADVNNFRISNFEADHYLAKDSNGRSTLKTVEKITAEFPAFDQNRGLERAIPKSYDGHSTNLSIKSVTNENGNDLEYETKSTGSNLILRIGDPDRYVQGRNTYVITYEQRDVTRYFQDNKSDEFYWDINGTQWKVPIDTLATRIHLDDALVSSLNGQTTCYIGVSGSTDRCDITRSGTTFTATEQNLAPSSNMTIAIGFSPQTFAAYEKSTLDRFLEFYPVLLVASFILGVIIFIIATSRWYSLTNRTKEIGTIVTEFLPPKDTSITTAASVVSSPRSVFTAQLLDFAVRHYIKIYQTKDKTFWSGAQYDIEIIRDVKELLPEEQEIFSDIFSGDTAIGRRLSLKSLQNNTALYYRMQDNDKKHTELVRGRYQLRAKDPARTAWFKKLTWVTIGLAILTLSPILLIIAAIVFAFGSTLWPLTDKGLALRRYLEGLKSYIKVAEADRLKILQSPEGAAKVGGTDPNDPSQIVKLYEQVLPYATLFGQEKEWNKQIGTYYESAGASPSWYAGQTAFNAAVFSSAMSSFATSASYSSASSSSSGGSSGGGSSGGGGGGGGGGGW